MGEGKEKVANEGCCHGGPPDSFRASLLLFLHFTHTYSDFSMPDSAQQEGEVRDWRGGSLVKRTYFVILKVRVQIPAPR